MGRKPKWWSKKVQDTIEETIEEYKGFTDKEAKELVAKGEKAYMAPDSRFNHPDLWNPHSKFRPADKIAVVVAYTITGSAKKAEIYTGVPSHTIYHWKNKSAWWPSVMDTLRKDANEEMDAMLTGILKETLENIIDRVENGNDIYDFKTGTHVKVPASARELTGVFAHLHDKRALMRGDPTSRTEKVNTDDRLDQLKKQFESFANSKVIEGTAERIED